MAEPLKNLYSKEFITRLAQETTRAYPQFKTNSFIHSVLDDQWASRELKQRTRHIVLELGRFLPFPYAAQVEILKTVAPHFRGYPAVLFPDFIEVFGLDDFDTSVTALELFTPFSSSEFAVRPFMLRYKSKMLKQHLKWARHPDHHVRRLASEGIRPRLPWAMALPEFKKDASPILPVLELLRNDESEYVRRSVANCLNDISKDHPGVVLGIVNRWKGASKETDWIVKHASRGLLKQGHTEALGSFGLNHAVKAGVTGLTLSKEKVKIGGEMALSFTATLHEKTPEKIRIEYRIYYVKANGKLSGKIFQVGTYDFEPGQALHIQRTHKFADLTTRKHHAGMHKIAIVLNGKELAEAAFGLC